MTDEEIDINLKGLKKINPMVFILLTFLCLFTLFFFMGETIGFNKGYHVMKDYYEEYISLNCFCMEKKNVSEEYQYINLDLDEIKK